MENNMLPASDYAEDKNTAYMPLFFAAARELINGQFNNTRDIERLHYGRCLGQVDKKADERQWEMLISEEMGFFLRIFPWLKWLLHQKSPITIHPRQDYAGSKEQALEQMVEEMEALMKTLGRKKLLIYIHGMEQTWLAAMVRLAIFAYLLRVTQKYLGELGYICLAISWASEGNGYGGAMEAAKATVPFVRDEVLPVLESRIGTENIVIVDHSMGFLIKSGLLKDRKPVSEDKRLLANISVAPDDDADVFYSCALNGFIAATQKDHTFIFSSFRDRLMLLSQCVHMGFKQIIAKFVRWIKGVKLDYPELRRLEHLRVGQILKLPRWPGITGVDYTLVDGIKWLLVKIFKFSIYFGYGHSIPYEPIKRKILFCERGGDASMYPNLEHTEIIDKPNSLLCLVAQPQEFNSVIEMLDA